MTAGQGRDDEFEFDLFLCHNSADKPAIRRIAAQLKRAKLRYWLDEEQLRRGIPWQRELQLQIANIRAAAVFVGSNGPGPWQDRELDAFLGQFVRRGCPVIPVILPDCNGPPQLPPFLEGMTWVDTRQAHPDPIQQIRFGVTGKPPRRARRSKPWLDDYRAAVLNEHGHITLFDSKRTFHLPLSEAYVPLALQRQHALSARSGWADLRVEQVFEPRAERAARIEAAEPLELEPCAAPTVAIQRVASRALIEGDAGIGKSTALEKLAIALLQNPKEVPGVPEGALPLFLRLADHARTRSIEALAKDTVLGLPGLKERRDLADAVWAHRPLVLLCDGLDELGNDEDRTRFLDELNAVFGAADDVWVAISCRPSGRGQTIKLPPEYRAFQILPLHDGEAPRQGPRAEFVRRWFGALEHQLEREGTTFPQRKAEEDKVLDALFSDRLKHPDALTLLSTPLFLSLFCTVSVDKDERPGTEVALFQAALRVLLERPTRKAPNEPPPWSADDAQAVLRPVSYHLQLEERTRIAMEARRWLDILEGPLAELDGVGLGRALTTLWRRQRDRLTKRGLLPDDADWTKLVEALLDQPREVLRAHGLTLNDAGWSQLLADPAAGEGPQHSAADFLYWLHHQAGLLEKHGLDKYLFRHRAFPEFLAAAHVVEGGLGHVLARSFVRPEWRETILYAVHLGQAEMFDALVDALLENRDPWYRAPEALTRMHEVLRQLHAPYSGHFATHLLQASLEEQKVILQLFAGRADDALLDAAEKLLEDAALAGDVRRLLEQRTRATGLHWGAEQDLDLGKDDRGEPVLLSVLKVPAGVLKMGSNEWPDTRPIHDVELSDFWLGRDPVTNRQYERFLRAKPETREPSFWRDRKYNDPSQPVVGVRWEEARAFCGWLQDQLRNAARVDLPTEAQWERAARGRGDRIFPWGNDKKPKTEVAYDRAWESGPARVGMHPADTGPFGHRDLAGNVLEWCLDVYVEDAYAHRAKGPRMKDPPPAQGTGAENEAHVMRGGAHWGAVDLYGSAFRNWRGVVGGDGAVGFRVCVSPPSTV